MSAAITSLDVSRLVRRLRDEAGLTQRELAERVGTTQSVISRLESDDYEGHSLSMLYRIGAALSRRIVVTAVHEGSSILSVEQDSVARPGHPSAGSMGEDAGSLRLRESAPSYGRTDSALGEPVQGLSPGQLDRLATRLARRFHEQGVTEADVREAICWARGETGRRSVAELRGVIEVDPGDVVADVRRARAQRGRETSGRR